MINKVPAVNVNLAKKVAFKGAQKQAKNQQAHSAHTAPMAAHSLPAKAGKNLNKFA